MRKAMSTYVYVKERLHPGLLQGLADAGAEAIEIFGARGHFDYSNRTHVREIAKWFKDSGVPFHSMHSPMFNDYDWGRSGSPPINVADVEKKRLIEAMDEIKRCLEVAEQAPFRFLVQHLGMGGESFDERKFEAGMTAVEHLRAFARPLGVTLLLENIPNELSTPSRLLQFLSASHLDDVGICFDVGHAHMMGGVAADFEPLKSRVRSTHVHDNNQDRDAHLWPGEGTIDWKQTLALLGAAPQVPPLLMEIDGEGRGNILQGMTAAFERLESAARAAAQEAKK
jgi:sugar phosphate isomerase/epimerase